MDLDIEALKIRFFGGRLRAFILLKLTRAKRGQKRSGQLIIYGDTIEINGKSYSINTKIYLKLYLTSKGRKPYGLRAFL